MAFRDAVAERLRDPEWQKFLKYSAASVVAVLCSVVLLAFFDGVLRWSPVLASTLATAISAIPSYVLNRRWAWGKTGRSHVWREVVPFWALALIGWAFSTYSVKLAEDALRNSSLSHPAKTGIDVVVYVAAFGILWVIKFIIFNRWLFIHHDRPAEPADGKGRPSFDPAAGH